MNSDHAKKNDERPPNPLNNATISGIDVIFTLRANSDPIALPTRIADSTNTGSMTFTSVTTTANSMPIADIKFPLTAVSSFPSILRPKINKIAEAT